MKPMLKATSLGVVAAFMSAAAPAVAQSDSRTELGLYAFGTAIRGDQQIGDLESDIDVSFSEIWDNLDIAFMGFVNHRTGRLSFTADLFYADLSAEDSSGDLDTEIGLQQSILGLYAGYNLIEDRGSANFLDVIGGLRFNALDASIDVEGTAADGTPVNASQDGDQSWTDVVLGVRGNYDFGNGWGLNGWLDAGVGEDSSSYQFLLSGNYTFDNNVKLYGGYRLYHVEYEDGDGDNRFEIDADYSGPIFGVSFQF